MDWYSFFKDFAGPAATVIAALAATYFARQQSNTAKRQADTAAQLTTTAKRQGEQQVETATQQAKTALDQLRFNLFEKRYAIYEDVERFLRTLINEGDKIKPLDVAPHYRVLDEAKFFVSPATLQWLETIRADSDALLEANAAQREGTGDSRRRVELQTRLTSHFSAMSDRFRDDMSFRQLTDRDTIASALTRMAR